MNCENVRALIRDYTDRELVAQEARAMDVHLASCPDCSDRLTAERDLKLVLSARGRPVPAPPGLAKEIMRRIRAETQRGGATPGVRSRYRIEARTRWAIGAAVFLVACLAAYAGWQTLVAGPVPGGLSARMPQELVDDHIRYQSLLEPGDLATGNPEAAELWFNPRLDIAVVLPRFKEGGAILEGARLCYVLDRRVALLFYQRGGQRLSLFVMSDSGLALDGMDPVNLEHFECATRTYKGYQVLCWREGGLLYALVGDQRQEDLTEMVSSAYRR